MLRGGLLVSPFSIVIMTSLYYVDLRFEADPCTLMTNHDEDSFIKGVEQSSRGANIRNRVVILQDFHFSCAVYYFHC